jgi:hypothetical protein
MGFIFTEDLCLLISFPKELPFEYIGGSGGLVSTIPNGFATVSLGGEGTET